MYETFSAYFLGAMFVTAMAYASSFMPARLEQRYWTIFTALAFAGFPPFPGMKGDSTGFWYELAVYGVIVALLVGSRWVPAMLALALFGHGLWDLTHLLGAVTIDKPIWIAQICVPFDWIAALYIFSRLRVWRESAGMDSELPETRT